ncbi:MAG: hypothetical protein EHM43_09835 [Ignavibacteriae bacterium]|nr:MAG: hypothetical protein EHM43_09835 [Ignavibacteriota bacterium]
MKFLAYNVCLLPPYEAFLSGEPLTHRRTRYTALNRYLKPLLMNADVVVFCEMFRYTFPGDQPVERIKDGLEGLGYHVVDTDLRDGSAVNSGVVVASRLPIVSSDYHRFEASIGDELLSAKRFYEVVLRTADNALVLLYGTHMQAHLGVENARVRAAQLRQIKTAMDVGTVRHRPTATLILGDLNIDGPLSADDVDDYDEYVNLMATFPGFTDTALRSGGELATWDPTTNSVIRSKHQYQPPDDTAELTRKERLDYLLVAPSTLAVNAATRVVRPRFKGEDGIRDLSDHYGLLGDVVLPAPTEQQDIIV